MSLEILQRTNFDWVTRLDDVWSRLPDGDYFVHPDVLRELTEEFALMQALTPSPMGRVVTGVAGAGKTHLLRHLRRTVCESHGGFFFLIDCTDIRDFWSTLMLGVLHGLQQDRGDGWYQAAYLRYWLSHDLYESPDAAVQDIFSDRSVPELQSLAVQTLSRLSHHIGGAYQLNQVLNALFLMTSQEVLVRECASMWMQGNPLDQDTAEALGFAKPSATAMEVLKPLTRLCSMFGPTVLAFDQLDALMSQHHFQERRPGEAESEASQRAEAILQSVGAGLMGLFDHSFRTLTVLSCLEDSWRILSEKMSNAATDRYRMPPLNLAPSASSRRLKQVLHSRLEPAAEELGGDSSSTAAIFDDQFFDHLKEATPRGVLKAADDHRRFCLKERQLIPYGDRQSAGRPDNRSEPAPAQTLDEPFEALIQEQDIGKAMTETLEDNLGEGLCKALALLRYELTLPEHVDFAVDADFVGGRSYPTLHARLRLIFHAEADREFHLCLRVLQKSNHSAFGARLNAAMVESGIDRVLPYRKLLLFRNTPRNFGGPATKHLIAKFHERGGRFLTFQQRDVAMIKALLLWKKNPPDGFEDWLRTRQPISVSESWGPMVAALKEGLVDQPPAAKNSSITPTPTLGKVTKRLDPARAASKEASKVSQTSQSLTLGRKMAGSQPTGEALTIPLENLTRHTVIRAGSGGGKTVLIKRLLEEAALHGVSSVVLDPGNDLVQLANDWPEPPSDWQAGDAERLAELRAKTDVVIYTPGRSAGRPLELPFLPEFQALADAPDELESAITNAVDRLANFIASGRSNAAHNKRGILAAALRQLARAAQPITLQTLADYLEELPPEADPGIKKADKLSADLCSALRALLAQQPNLDQPGGLNWAELFGLANERPRISVINFTGLPEIGQQQEFVNGLAESLFTWSKQHPSAGPSGMTGLFVIDEAKEFLPATRSSPCKTSLMRLAAQARKYGVGLVFATQNPKDLDYNSVAQFSTQCFGRANAPQVIDFIEEVLRSKGAAAAHPSKLGKGEFYVCSEGLPAPIKIRSPLCLTYHPDGRPLTQDEILVLARKEPA